MPVFAAAPSFSSNPRRLAGLAGFVLGALLGLGLTSGSLAATAIADLVHPTAAAASAASQPAPAAEPSFFIAEFAVEGNTVLSVPTVEQAVMPFLGPDKRFADIEAARKALENAYQSAGYLTVFVDIPEQRLSAHAENGEGNVVTLHVTEGKIDRLAIKGAQYHSPERVRETVTALAEGSVPNFNAVQQELGSVNTSDEMRVQPVLRPGKTPGTVEAELQVADRLPFSGEVELNNRQSPNTKPLRLNATLRYDNLFQSGQSASLTLIASPQNINQTQVEVFNYSIPAGSGSWALYALHSNSNVVALGALTVLGKGNVLGAHYVLPLTSGPALLQSLNFGIELKHFNQSTTGPLRYAPVSLAYNAAVNREHSQTQFSVLGTVGPREWLGRTEDCGGLVEDEFACSREGADRGFSTVRLDVKHTQFLWNSWSASVRLGGQYTDAPLVSNEEFAIGGVDSVRGYLEAEQVGDRAFQGSIDLQSPNWAQPSNKTWSDIRAHAFFDVAHAYVIGPSVDQASGFLFSGVGLGLNLRAGKRFSGDLDIAWPLKNDAPYTQAYHPRLNGRMVVDF